MAQACEPLLGDFMSKIDVDVIGTKYNKSGCNGVDNRKLNAVNAEVAHSAPALNLQNRTSPLDIAPPP